MRTQQSQTILSKIFRHSTWDILMVMVSLVHGMALVTLLVLGPQWMPISLLAIPVALGVCWNANTVSHNHLHNPFFHSPTLNQFYNLYLTLLTSIPQSIWKEKHLWHHAGEPKDYRKRGWSQQKVIECSSVALLWLALYWSAPSLFLWAYLPGYLIGLWFCQIQGHYEHAHEEDSCAGVSHYGKLYNFIWFNDGYHMEHHRAPRRHWTQLPHHQVQPSEATISDWSPHLRWFDTLAWQLNRLQSRCLGYLEQLALQSSWLQRWMIAVHQKAFAQLLTEIDMNTLQHITIVGGGMFPRTLLALQPLLPDCHFQIMDQDALHIEQAIQYLTTLNHNIENVTFVEASFSTPQQIEADAIVIPLALLGLRDELYHQQDGPVLFIHDWLWHRKGNQGAIIAKRILKRLNLVKPNS